MEENAVRHREHRIVIAKLKMLDDVMAEYVKALQAVADPNATAAEAIMQHIDKLVDERARILGLSEEEIARIDAESEAAVQAQIDAEKAALLHALVERDW